MRPARERKDRKRLKIDMENVLQRMLSDLSRAAHDGEAQEETGDNPDASLARTSSVSPAEEKRAESGEDRASRTRA